MTNEENIVGPWVEENPVECVLLVQRGSGPVPEVRRATTDDVAKAMGTTPAEVLRVQLEAEKEVTEKFRAERDEARDALARSEAWTRRLNEDAEKAQRHLGEERRQCAERFTRTCEQLDQAKAEARTALAIGDALTRAIGVPSGGWDKSPAEHAMWLLDGVTTKAKTIHEAIAVATRAAGVPFGIPLSKHVTALRKQMANDAAVIAQLKQQLEDAKRSNDSLSRMIQTERECSAIVRGEAKSHRDLLDKIRIDVEAKMDETTENAVRRIVASRTEGA